MFLLSYYDKFILSSQKKYDCCVFKNIKDCLKIFIVLFDSTIKNT